jgi:hypothetical protein
MKTFHFPPEQRTVAQLSAVKENNRINRDVYSRCGKLVRFYLADKVLEFFTVLARIITDIYRFSTRYLPNKYGCIYHSYLKPRYNTHSF